MMAAMAFSWLCFPGKVMAFLIFSGRLKGYGTFVARLESAILTVSVFFL